MVSIHTPEACLVVGEVPVEADVIFATIHDVCADIAHILAVDGEGVLGQNRMNHVDALSLKEALAEALGAVCGRKKNKREEDNSESTLVYSFFSFTSTTT